MTTIGLVILSKIIELALLKDKNLDYLQERILKKMTF